MNETDLNLINDKIENDSQLTHRQKVEMLTPFLDALDTYDERLKTQTLINYARELYNLGSSERAQEIAMAMYETTQSKGYHELHMRCCNLLGNISSRMGYYALALDYYQQSLQAIERHALKSHYRSTLLNNIASIYSSLKLYDSAVKYYYDALELSVQESNSDTQFLIYYNLGDIYVRQQKEALTSELVQAMRHMIQTTCQTAFHKCLWKLLETKYHRMCGAYSDMKQSLASVLDYLELEDDAISRIEYDLEYSRYHRAMENFESAFEYARHAFEQVALSGEFEFERESLTMLCCAAEQKGDLEALIRYQKKLLAIDETFIGKMNEMTLFQIEEKSASSIAEQLNHNSVKLLENMHYIYELSHDITKVQDIEAIFNLIIQKLLEFVTFDALVIGLYDQGSQAIYNRMMYHNGEVTRGEDLLVSNKSSLAAWCIRNRQEIYTGFNSTLTLEDFEPLYVNFPDYDVPYESVLYLPLYDDDEIIGIFSLQKFERHAFDHYELEMVRAITSYIAIALNNAMKTQELNRLNVELENLSLKDGLSGLYNRYALNLHFRKFFDNVQSMGMAMSIMMIDIDYFKEYNDRYGHLAGDHMIQHVASIIVKHLPDKRAKAYRYGGDEFLAIIVDDGDFEAKAIGLSILEEMRSAQLEHDTVGIGGIVTLSIGAVNYQDLTGFEGEDPMLIRADTALYQAKRNGRNRVIGMQG